MGRTAGCPARPGRVGVRGAVGGAPGAGVACGCINGVVERAAGEAAVPLVIRTGSSGRALPGNGCLGPDRIWPGRGAAGTGLGAGGVGAELTGAGAPGMASGGRRRCACGTTRWGMLSSVRASSEGSASRGASGAAGGPSCCIAGAPGSSAIADAEPLELVCATGSTPPPPPKMRRSFSATSSSIELEWVFFSVTPSSGSLSSSS